MPIPCHRADEQEGIGGGVMVGEHMEQFVGDVVHSLHRTVHGCHHFRHILCTGRELILPGQEHFHYTQNIFSTSVTGLHSFYKNNNKIKINKSDLTTVLRPLYDFSDEFMFNWFCAQSNDNLLQCLLVRFFLEQNMFTPTISLSTMQIITTL